MKKLISINLALLLYIVLSSITFDIPKRSAKHMVAIKNIDHPSHTEGTGFYILYKDKSYILTNKHVCNGKSSVLTDYGFRKVIAEAESHDICLVESKREDGLKMALLPAESLDKLYILGYPDGNPLTAREGRVVGPFTRVFSWISKYETTAILLSAVAFPGSSGSPVLNERGRIVGILFAVNMRTFEDSFMVPLESLQVFMAVHGR